MERMIERRVLKMTVSPYGQPKLKTDLYVNAAAMGGQIPALGGLELGNMLYRVHSVYSAMDRQIIAADGRFITAY